MRTLEPAPGTNGERKILINIAKKKLGVCRIRSTDLISSNEFMRCFMELNNSIIVNHLSYEEIGTTREEFDFIEARAKLKRANPQ